MEKDTIKFFEFSQNNSGGHFDCNEKVCHRLFIEAKNAKEAKAKAVELGVYFNGVSMGIDCPCCGDRWSDWLDDDDFKKFPIEYKVCTYDHYNNPEQLWKDKYGAYEIVESPRWKEEYSFRKFEGKVKFLNIEEYAQYLSDEYGWTVPDCRIFYSDGTVKEIFSKKK